MRGVLYKNEKISKKSGNARSKKQDIQPKIGVEETSSRIKGKCQSDTV